MKSGSGGAVIREIGSLFEGASVAGLDEVQLLERFVARRDGLAFAALVARHGPMVLGVCRRVLTDPHDIEDAFQATFLVLVRKAGSIRDRDRLAPWLFGVARKVANRARLDRSRRRAREVSGSELMALAPSFDEHRAELGRALVEEIDRLPDSLRIPVILCCVEGLSYDEAAAELGSTEPAIRGRLSRARERLRGRLARKGFAPSLGALGVFFSAETVSSAVPVTLMASTTRAAIVFAAGRAATAGTIPVAIASLAEGVIRTMILTKSKIAATALIACGLAGSTVGVLGQQPTQTTDQDSAPAAAAPARTPAPARASSPDRLDSLEAKLDRLIRALEGSASLQSATTVDSTASEATTVAGRGPSDVVPAPAAGTRSIRRVQVAEGKPAVRGSGVATVRGTDQRPARDTSSRLDAVEENLERLESRLAEIERRLGPLPSPGDLQPSRSQPSRSESRTRNRRSSDSADDDLPVIPDTGGSNPFESAAAPSPDAEPKLAIPAPIDPR